MCRPLRSILVALAIAATAVMTKAQTEAPAENPPEGSSTAPAPKPKRERAISDGVASSLAATMPKYNPPPKPKPEDEEIDLRETDKPRNGIIRLPKYTVQEKKPPVFRERDLYSSAKRTDLALRRYAGLQFGPFSNLNRPVATAMYAETERLQSMAEMKDAVNTVGVVDKEDAVYLKRISEETYLRSSHSDLDSLGDAWSTQRSK